jgi:protein-tyrosine phosphatase
MIDIHCHALPGVDDGAKTFEVAVEMCRMAARDGITHLVVTPHCNYRYPYDPQGNRAKLSDLQAATGSEPCLLLGCDFHLSVENVDRVPKEGRIFSINGTQYLLVEFQDLFIPEQMDNVLFDIDMAGFTPILTHPERNAVFKRKPELLLRWVNRGYLAQVTAMSLLGGFGSTAETLVSGWLEQNLIHFFATDAHDLTHRPPTLSSAYQRVVGLRGEEEADRIFVKNPEAVINGRPLPPGPAPAAEKSLRRKKKTWFGFLKRGA